jgi:hypothetical protein
VPEPGCVFPEKRWWWDFLSLGSVPPLFRLGPFTMVPTTAVTTCWEEEPSPCLYVLWSLGPLSGWTANLLCIKSSVNCAI